MITALTDRFTAWLMLHFGGLADWLMSLDPNTMGWIVLLGFLALTLGWNVLSRHINRRLDTFDVDWMDADAWEATR